MSFDFRVSRVIHGAVSFFSRSLFITKNLDKGGKLVFYGTPEGYSQVRAALADRFGELAQHAARSGGVVALEPHVGQAMDLPEKVEWLMQAVNSPHFRLNLDNSHFEVMGCDLDDYLPKLVPYAVHTDLKDQRGRSPAHETWRAVEKQRPHAATRRAKGSWPT